MIVDSFIEVSDNKITILNSKIFFLYFFLIFQTYACYKLNKYTVSVHYRNISIFTNH